MKSAEINAIYAAKAAEYLAAGYTINTNSMNGSQGEIAKIDFRKGDEVIRLMLNSAGELAENLPEMRKGTAEKMSELRGFDRRRSQVLQRMRNASAEKLSRLRKAGGSGNQILSGMRHETELTGV